MLTGHHTWLVVITDLVFFLEGPCEGPLSVEIGYIAELQWVLHKPKYQVESAL